MSNCIKYQSYIKYIYCFNKLIWSIYDSREIKEYFICQRHTSMQSNAKVTSVHQKHCNIR